MNDSQGCVMAMLERYAQRWPDESEVVGRICELVETRVDCLLRTCFEPGHVTASSWIVTPDRRFCLLTHHRKLGKWLQLGGHSDGDPRIQEVALREAREESGMARFELLRTGGEQMPLDLDVHVIPARQGEPAHEHHDLRFLLVADPGQPIVVSDESHDVRWVEVEQLRDYTGEESVLRLARKARVTDPIRPIR